MDIKKDVDDIKKCLMQEWMISIVLTVKST